MWFVIKQRGTKEVLPLRRNLGNGPVQSGFALYRRQEGLQASGYTIPLLFVLPKGRSSNQTHATINSIKRQMTLPMSLRKDDVKLYLLYHNYGKPSVRAEFLFQICGPEKGCFGRAVIMMGDTAGLNRKTYCPETLLGCYHKKTSESKQ